MSDEGPPPALSRKPGVLELPLRERLKRWGSRGRFAATGLRQRLVPDRHPSVLVAGDSISRGVGPHLQTALGPAIPVIRSPENGYDSYFGRRMMPFWLWQRRWTAVVFNWGLHDIVGTASDPHTPLDDYLANLGHIVSAIEDAGAVPIFRTTTWVPPKAAYRSVDAVAAFNAAALDALTRRGVLCIDLFDRSRLIHRDHGAGRRYDNVHYDQVGYRLLAEALLEKIRAQAPGLSAFAEEEPSSRDRLRS